MGNVSFFVIITWQINTQNELQGKHFGANNHTFRVYTRKTAIGD